jgi:hypothetical protein
MGGWMSCASVTELVNMRVCSVSRGKLGLRPATPGDWEKRRAVAKKTPNTWYVAVSIPHKEKIGHDFRRSRTFASESDAKRFAAARIAEGVEVSAGTLNPVVPKRVIGPSQIEAWLSEPVGGSAT